MASKKLEQQKKLEEAQEAGKKNIEGANEHLNEANESAEAMAEIEAVDDDDVAALEAARSSANERAKMISESEIKNPGAEIGEKLKETSEESKELAEKESEAADQATGMTGSYSEIGSELSKKLMESGQEFEENAEESDATDAELEQEYLQIAGELEGAF